ncbi:hypothetical protein HDV62DRAFT_405077 [Trichoderma sp. SZMC 28011]
MSIPSEAGPSAAGPSTAGPSTAGPSTSDYYKTSPYGAGPSMPGPSRRKSQKRRSVHDLPTSLSPIAEPSDFPADVPPSARDVAPRAREERQPGLVQFAKNAPRESEIIHDRPSPSDSKIWSLAIGAKNAIEAPSTMFRKKKDPRVIALLESADETLLDGDDEARQEHSRASDAAIALRPKDSDTLNLAHKIDDLVEQSKPKQREQPNSTRPAPSRNSPRASAQFSSPGQPAQPVSAQRSPQGQPAQPPMSAQTSPQGRPAQPISAHNSPQGRPVQPASAQNSPQGRPAQPISAQNSPQGRSVQPASALRSPQRVSVPRSPQGQSVRPISGGIPLDWSPEQNVPRSQYYDTSNHPLRLTSSPQRQRQQQRRPPTPPPQQQEEEEEEEEEESEEEEGEPMNAHQQEHLKRMLQEAGLWPPARLQEALASQTSAFVPETSSGNSITTLNQIQNQGDVVESAKDNLDADAEAAGNTENAATKRSPLATMKKWFQNAAHNKRKQE